MCIDEGCVSGDDELSFCKDYKCQILNGYNENCESNPHKFFSIKYCVYNNSINICHPVSCSERNGIICDDENPGNINCCVISGEDACFINSSEKCMNISGVNFTKGRKQGRF
jgi:hypothetical protein